MPIAVTKSKTSPVLRSFADLLGSSRVRYDSDTLASYQRNTGALSRAVDAIVYPTRTDEVQQVVRLANTHRVPLYPISCIKNWGLGSHLPVQDGAVIVDLSGMNRIHEVRPESGYAVVEPGVTQQQLHQFLQSQGLPLTLNATRAGTGTSLIGNALERGIGYGTSQSDALSALEVVLGTGERLCTGFGHYENSPLAHLYRPGVGPSLDGLFAQSNFGIVTRAGVELMPEPSARLTIRSTMLAGTTLSDFVDGLGDLVRSGVIDSVVHLANRVQTERSMAPLLYRALEPSVGADPDRLRAEVNRLLHDGAFGPWNAVCGVGGTAVQLGAKRREIRARLRRCARTSFWSDRAMDVVTKATCAFQRLRFVQDRQIMIRAMAPLYEMTKGVPSDASLDSVSWPTEGQSPGLSNDLDQERTGVLLCLPLVPMEGGRAESMVGEVERTFKRYGLPSALTLNMVGRKVIEFVIAIPFDKREAASRERAHACLREMYDAFMARGYYPYRVGIESMGRVVDPKDPYWHTVRALKRVMDPNGIIAPGRYSLH